MFYFSFSKSIKFFTLFTLAFTALPGISQAMDTEERPHCQKRLPSALTKEQKITGRYIKVLGEPCLVYHTKENNNLKLGVPFCLTKIEKNDPEAWQYVSKSSEDIRAIAFSSQMEEVVEGLPLHSGDKVTLIVKGFPVK